MSHKQAKKLTIKNPYDIYTALKKWKNRRQENFLAITLDGSHSIIKTYHITKGLVNRTLIHPRECFWPAVKDCAVAIVFAHNHPSGYAMPSPEDDETTKNLCMAGSILGIRVLDHIILTKNDTYYSYRQSGHIKDDFPPVELKDFTDRIATEQTLVKVD
jgi:DNA repair protein RadC